jgi:inhibitor of KinA
MKWSPLGENGVLVWCADEASAAALAGAAHRQIWPWLIDVVQAYASVAVYFEGARAIAIDAVVGHLQSLATEPPPTARKVRHRVPICYERQLDLDRISAHAGMGAEAVIRAHAATPYVVYAIGFCPGFPYLGYLPDAIANVPRLSAPRLRVPAGSIGLTGRQTGIYTEARPGGWNILGQTPLELVNVADNYFPLRTGDGVEFARIDETEFTKLAGHRL